MNFTNLNIGKRLGLGFGLIGAMLVALLATSNVMLGRINAGTDEIVNNRMPRIEASSRVLNEVNEIAIALRNMMLNEDPADRQKQIDEIASSRKEIAALMDDLDKSLQTPRRAKCWPG